MWIFQNTERKPLAQPINNLLAAKDRPDADVLVNAGASVYSRRYFHFIRDADVPENAGASTDSD